MKMKKVLATVLSLVMVAGLAACGHKHNYVKVDAKAATCTATGNSEYYKCSDCDKIFLLQDGKYVEVSLDSVTTAKLAHTLDHHEAVEATHTENGNIEYWSCSVCGHKFGDAAGTRELTDAQVIIPKLSVDDFIDYFDILDEEDELFTYKAYVCYDLLYTLQTVFDDRDNLEEVLGTIVDNYEVGIQSIANGTSVAEIMVSYNNAKQSLMNPIPLANGVFNFTQLSKADRTVLTGIVERYLVTTGLSGITLYESGAYVMYNERITLGSENYIPGYGFGVLAEGAITADLESETNPAWKRYYHTYETSNPNHMLYWDDQGQQVGDLYSYIGASYFETFMSPTKDSYIWVGSLSKDERPVAIDPDANGNSTKWKIAIRTGADGLKYNTLSTIESRAAYNNRGVEAEDYLIPYMVLLNQHNALYRGSEAAANASKTISIKGIADYFNATKNTEALYDADLFHQYVSLDVVEEDGQWYLVWENNEKTSPFDAMYYIAGNLYSPLPASFIELVGLENMFSHNTDKTETPVDNSLSLGAYTCESWGESEIVFKKNPNYVDADNKYSIEGVHIKILPGIQTDVDLAIKEFLAGNLDSASLTENYLTSTYMNDPRTRRAVGGSNFKLNVNACTPEVWAKYFGVNGSIVQTQEEDYWDLKPLMSNIHFIRGLSYGLDRRAVAEAFGVIPSVSYLGSTYMADAEAGLSYNLTEEHAHAIELLTTDTVDGYSLELARDYFKMALMECEAAGTITPGTIENPTILTIEIAWMYVSMEETYHSVVKQCWEQAFNDDSVTGGLYELNIEFCCEATEYTWVYFEKLMPGQFDIGFGSISGNTYNILDYFTVLSADPDMSGGFTLTFGPDTNSATEDLIIYNGMRWSFDAILTAANTTGIVKDGINVHAYDIVDDSVTVNDDGSWTVTYEVNVNVPDPDFTALDVVAFGDTFTEDGQPGGEGYYEESVVNADGSNLTFVVEDGVATVTCVISSEFVQKYLGTRYDGYLGLDLYFSLVSGSGDDAIDFSPTSGYAGSIYVAPAPAEQDLISKDFTA